jgi:amino acid adenylation domain-containing protein/non-ribosomal peptide synthase protein (TIGR01720 family)
MSPVRFIKNPLAWLEAITEYKASICGAPNFAFDHCIDRIRPYQLIGIDLSSWRIAFNAAEPVDADTLDRFCDRFSRVGFKESAIFPAYGMAEATVFICGGAHATSYLAHPFSREALQKGQAKLPQNSDKQQILIGHGHVQANHHLKIVSPENLMELSEGQVGEILFSGPSLAQGYWGDAERTEESFGAYLDNDQNKYLRTGDLGFIHHGELYISGRIKDVMIIKGRNYYPQDFEKLAYDVCTGLNQNGASAFEVKGKAFLLLEVSRDMLKQFDYKLACEVIKEAIFEQFEVLLEDIVFVKAGRLNRTSSGKIQRALIKSRYLSDDIDCLFSSKGGIPEEDNLIENAQVVVTLSEMEEELCALWQEVFGLETIGVEDNFLNLGGHSLLATSLISQIQKKWNVDISIRDFLTANTIRKLTKVIENASTNQLPSIHPVSNSKDLLPSYAQERLWLVHQIESDCAQYNLSFSLKLYGELSNAFLHKAFETILTRHQVLRTTFKEQDGQVYQSVQESFQFEIPTINLTELTKVEQVQKVAELNEEEARNLFDLSRDLMLRVKLLKLNSQAHIMLLTVHHIAADGWSMGILTKELNILYSALVQGLEVSLQPLDVQYIDYAHWQRSWLKESVLQNHLNYWKEHLNNLPAAHNLPLDNARPKIQSFKGASIHHKFSAELQEDLHNLAREHGATFFMFMNAAFASLLNRYSGESDIVIGSPIANREQAELTPLMGIFINNLVFRSDLSADPSFLELLQQSKERTFAAYEHQQAPFEKLVDELQPERSLSHSPLFQVMLILQNQEMESLNLYGLDAQRIQPKSTVAQYDLTLTLHESENGLGMEWEYATDLFSRTTIERMIGHFEVLLRGVLKSPETKVSQLPILNNEESIQLLKNWNDTTSEYPKDKCIHELFELQVANSPNGLAAVFGTEKLTYEELNQRANRLAHYLVKQGVAPDSVVGVCVERSMDMLVAVLAIMKSGGAYLPLDPSYPRARLAYMVEDSGVKWIITQKHLRDLLVADQIICLDSESCSAEFMQSENTNLAKESLGLEANNLSYLIYTSGSTGNPKGVMLEHRNLTNFLTSMQEEPGFDHEDVLLAVTSLSFDIHALELYLPLIVGGRVVIASSEDVLSPDELAQLIDEHSVTSMQATPATWKMLVNNDWQPQKRFKVFCGGEALSKELKDDLLAKETIELWNMYGPTETAVWSATNRIEKGVSLGAPIANTQFYVLDDNLSAVPVGVAGELYIGGEGVARGYFNRPELTVERFIQNPYDHSPHTRLYKTGDLVRWLPNGTLEYLRRVDLQVKVRGHRIELEEIESCLKLYSEIYDAVAHVWTDGDSSNLVAYVTGKSTDIEHGLQQKLTDHLGLLLPAYMVPNRFVFLDQIPLTPNGKIDRKALPKPQISDDLKYVVPETATEKQLCQIWQQLLNLGIKEEQGISVTSNFFHLGGHSLLAARLVSQIRKHWNVEVPIRAVFTEQTIRKLAKVVDDSSISQIPEIVPICVREHMPLSFAQKRLWFIDQIEGGRHQYNLCRGFQLFGELDLPSLLFAFKRIVERHEILRTTYQNINGGAIQVINSDLDIEIPTVNLTGLSAEEQKQTMLAVMKEETNRVFDLSTDLMIRVKLLKFDNDYHALLVVVHHIAMDGWSESIIVKELNSLYHTKEGLLPPLKIQYCDYSCWQNNWLQGDVLEHQLKFWKERLKNLPDVHNLPLDHPRPVVQSYEGLRFNHVLNSDLQKGLNGLAKKHDASLFMVLNAAFALLLSRYSNEDDIVIGTPIANRKLAEVAPLVGFFANTLVLRSDLSGNPSFESLLKQSRNYLLESYEHQQLPFEKLIEELQPGRSLSFSPLFQVMLVMQNNEYGELELPGLVVKEFSQQSVTARYDLTLSVIVNPPLGKQREVNAGGLTLSWEYPTALFDSSTIERMAEHFEMLLKSIVEKPQAAISQLTMLTAEEGLQIEQWNDTTADYPKDKCVHELFEQQVKSDPTAIAVKFEKRCLTFEELNSKSNKLAHYLIEEGVKPDSVIGLCIERSLDMVIGILGIIKAGGAYLPLDPKHPRERLNYMLEDSGAEILLTHEHLLVNFDPEKQAIFCLGRPEALDKYPGTNIDMASLEVTPQNLIHVIYTSGSTGKPKGVESVHQGLVNRLCWGQLEYKLRSDDRVLQKTPYSFDVSCWELFWPLCFGAQLILAEPEGHKDPEYLRTLIKSHQITTLHFVPSMFASMLTVVERSDLTSIRYVFCSGEALPKKLVDDFMSIKGKDTQLFNLYGPTESSIEVSHWTCRQNEQLDFIPMGRPISNVQLHVLDKELRPVPVGVAGELYISGDGLARGYMNLPDVTDDRFIPNPFCNGKDTHIYRTGDLVRRLPNVEGLSGNLAFIGRIDHQVKIRGFRIELGEIESAILSYAGIVEATVVAKRDDNGEVKHMIAYVVAGTPFSSEKNGNSESSEQAILIDKIRYHLKQSLPEQMIPSAFVVLDKLPLTASGKVNRKALPKPNIQAHLSSQFIAPKTDIERRLSDIWQSLLKIDQVNERGEQQGSETQVEFKYNAIGINDNFFELGGHSLLVIRLISEIRSSFEMEITVGDVFRQPTIFELASLIEKRESAPISILSKMPEDEPLVLSFAQQSLWLVEQINPNQTQYNISMALQLDGGLDFNALNSAFESIIERHQILRTTVRLSNSGNAVPVILKKFEFSIPLEDITDLNNEEQNKVVLDYAREEANTPFDLSTDLMLRVQLLKLSQYVHIVLVTMHHIASDGWSQGILLNEFNSMYRSFIGGETETLAQLPIQYTDYAWRQRCWLQEEVLEQHLSFWNERLRGLPEVHNLPLDHTRPIVHDNKGAIYHQTLSREIQENLKALARKYDATLFMVMSAAYSILLSRYSGETDIVFGTPVANRDQVELTSLVGFFTNALVIRTDLSDNPNFNDLLQRSKDYLLGAYEHQQLPFEKLVDELQQDRNLSYSPLYQVKLALQNNELGEIDLPNLTIKQLEQPHSVAQHDLSLDVYELEEEGQAKGLKFNWEYATSLFDASTIERLAKHFEVLLKGIIANPQAKVSELPVITKIESQQLLNWSKWSSLEDHLNVSDFSSKKDISVLDMFEEQVAKNPNSVAAMIKESAHVSKRLTYAELNAKANQVANYLIEKEIASDTLVGLCIERSLEMVIGIFGILKAGAAYVPIDPDYPEKQVEHILDDSGIEIILTSSELLSELPFDDLQILPLDDEMWEGFLGCYSEDNLDRNSLNLSLDDLAYVIYTSGSTGLPKGVAVELKALAKSTLSRFEVYREVPTAFALFSSFAFDSSIAGIFWTLVSGGKLCIVDIRQGIDMASFEAIMLEEQISHFLTLPSLYQAILSSGIQPGNSLKTVIVAGETCERSLVKQHQSLEKWQHHRLFNEYGPTEACVWSSYYDCTYHTDGIVPIGATAPHAELFVLDNELQHCPLGVTGELYVSGDNLARCYLNQPELTNEKFVPSPFNNKKRLYKTGDLVRCMPCEDGLPGNLEFIGRRDHQIKIRGFRIELGEIEKTIVEHEYVSEAVVLAKSIGSSHGVKQLVAYVVPSKGNDADRHKSDYRETLLTYLRKSLTSHKVPSVFVVLDKLPHTSNGKIDRQALQGKEVPPQLTCQYVEPKTEVEKQLSRIWQNLLNVKRVGITDNFFAIGGDSILAIQVVTRAAKEGLVFTTRQLFECQSIENLASTAKLESQKINLNREASEHYSLINDLSIRFEQWKQNQLGEKLATMSSERIWGEFLAEHSGSALQKEKAFWLTQADTTVNSLPTNHSSISENSETLLQQVLIQLTESETQFLLNDCAAVYRTEPKELLLSSLYLALHDWTKETAFCIDIEIDEHELVNEELDLTPTVALFTNIYPLHISVEPEASIDVIIKTIKEQLRTIPDNGIGFGILRNFVKDDDICQAYPQQNSEIAFNYLEQSGRPVNIQTANLSSSFQSGRRLTFNGMVNNGLLEFYLDYDTSLFAKEKMISLAESMESTLRQVIIHCQSEGAGGVTPSDFPLADVTQSQLDSWFSEYSNLEKLYPTTGMQHGMLYHSSLDKEAYVSQLSVKLVGKIDSVAFKHALSEIVKRYDVFRTVFTDDFAYQLVLPEASLDFTEVSWLEFEEAEQRRRLEQFLKQDKALGFDVKQAPLMRVTLVELSQEQHYLIWSSHHALSDGWSFPLIFKDVIKLYVAAREYRNDSHLSSVLPKVQPYGKYIEWLQRQDKDKAKSFWKDMLASFETPTPIYVDKKTSEQSREPRKQWLNLTSEKSIQLQSLARHYQVTLNTLVQAAWAYLLHRYSGEEQLVFGETVSGRPSEIKGIEEIVGLFINSLPVKVNIESKQEIGNWLKTLHQASIARIENGFITLSDIQSLSSVSNKEGSERNLFDTLVVFENFPVDLAMEKAVVGSELTVTNVKVFEQTNYALTLSVLPENNDSGNKLSFKLGYHDERFDESVIIRLLSHFELILNGLLDSVRDENPIKVVGELPLLTSSEEQQLLVHWNETASDYPEDQCIHELFVEQALASPDKIAIVDAFAAINKADYAPQLTFQQLCERSQTLALYLQFEGVKPDSLIGLCVDRSPDMVVGFLGILQAGGAYLPLEPDYPDDRLAYMLEDSQTKIILTQEKMLDKLSVLVAPGTKLIALDKQWGEVNNRVTKLLAKGFTLCHEVKADNLAYVIYTSGSTGKPKGVMIEHRMVVDYCFSVFKTMPIEQCETFAAVSTFAADLGNIALFVPLVFSKTLHLFSNYFVNQPVKLKEYLDHHPIDCMKITPSHFEMFKISDTEIVVPSKVLIFAGEPLNKGIVETVNRLKPGCKVFNNYGPTETTISKLSSSPLNSDDLSTIYLGKPLHNTKAYVLDQYSRPQPVGVAGELHIAGDGVARGYLNLPELTKEKFVANPFLSRAGKRYSRMYKTGDLVRWSEDGNLEYLGRIDNQLKIRGFRIEVGEIEARLKQHREIKDCAVVNQGEGINKQLIAFYVVANEVERNTTLDENLRTHLLSRLPEYMLPAAFINLETIPLTPNGKINRRYLECMDVSLESSQSYVAPSNEIEMNLVELWAEVLELDPENIGVNDNFFELGGHSLKATRVISKVSYRLGIDLPLESLFNLPTIAGMSEFIHATQYRSDAALAEDGSGELTLEEGTL